MIEPIIGIDLGTTHTVFAVYHQGRIVVIPSAVGQPLTPSVVRCAPNGRIVVGEAALRGGELAFDTTVLSAKRLIGQRGGQDVDIHPESTPLPPSPDGFGVLDVAVQSASPVEVAAALFVEARRAAETYLGQEVRRTVVTFPARFDTVLEAKVLIERWRQTYNTFRPHSSLGYRPLAPAASRPCPLASASLRKRTGASHWQSKTADRNWFHQWGKVTPMCPGQPASKRTQYALP